MRAAFAAAVSVAVCAGLVWGCDESTEPPTASTADAASSGTASDGGAGGPRAEAGGSVTTDRAPTGCVLWTTGYTPGTRAENVARTDVQNAASWTGVENAIVDDGKFATVTLAPGQESAKLRVSGFGFHIPDSAETWGIEVELKRRAPDGGVEDQQVNVEIEGKTSRFKYLTTEWPTSIVGTHDYGQAVDTWGVDLYPADVNKASFAATLTVKRAASATGPVTAIVDSLKVAVHYCPDPIKK